MIVLPNKAIMVLQDEAVQQEKKSLILTQEDFKAPKKPDTGTIIFTGPDLIKYQLCKVKFKPAFTEEVIFKDQEYLYIRDFESSIYWVIEDENKTE